MATKARHYGFSVSVDSEVMCLETSILLCGHGRSVGTPEMDLHVYRTSVGTAESCCVDTHIHVFDHIMSDF